MTGISQCSMLLKVARRPILICFVWFYDLNTVTQKEKKAQMSSLITLSYVNRFKKNGRHILQDIFNKKIYNYHTCTVHVAALTP